MDEKVSTEKAQQIKTLAENFKKLHLAATIDEAYEKAKKVILENAGEKKSAEEIIREDQIRDF